MRRLGFLYWRLKMKLLVKSMMGNRNGLVLCTKAKINPAPCGQSCYETACCHPKSNKQLQQNKSTIHHSKLFFTFTGMEKDTASDGVPASPSFFQPSPFLWTYSPKFDSQRFANGRCIHWKCLQFFKNSSRILVKFYKFHRLCSQ